MAIYHLSVKPVKRAAGRSVTAAAAYRAADRIRDQQTGQVFDYTRKRGVVHEQIVLPSDATRRDINWPRDRTALWNAAEGAERRKDARVAREYELALPHELTHPQRVALVHTFAQDIANRYHAAVDFALHAPHREGDQRNYHAHVLTTTREITPVGLGAKTTIELSDADRRKRGLEPAAKEIEAIRTHWANLTNEALRIAQHDARIDHRSLEAQGVEREPTTHKGPALTNMERHGARTEVSSRLEAEATERLTRAAEFGRLEREAAPVAASILALDTDLTAARQARDAELGHGLRAQAERALAGWREAKTADAEHTRNLTNERDDTRSRESDRSIRYDPWDLGL